MLEEFINFVDKDTIVAHNASFDMKFIQTALNSNGYSILYNDVIDTLQLSRKYIFSDNYKLETLKELLDINVKSHDALNDCYVAGMVYLHCCNKISQDKLALEASPSITTKNIEALNEDEAMYLDQVKEILRRNGRDIDVIRFYKGTTLNILAFSPILRIKILKKARYFILSNEYMEEVIKNFEFSSATQSEGYNNFRAKFTEVSDIDKLESILIKEYDKAICNMENYIENTKNGRKYVESYLNE